MYSNITFDVVKSRALFDTSTATLPVILRTPPTCEGAIHVTNRDEMNVALTTMFSNLQLSAVVLTKFEPRTKTAVCPVTRPRSGTILCTEASGWRQYVNPDVVKSFALFETSNNISRGGPEGARHDTFELDHHVAGTIVSSKRQLSVSLFRNPLP